MIDSGERLDLSRGARPTVDKHSTGGVGDKVSLILAPLVASCGAAVPQLSGRGLGHTGGTLDKLESIPGWRAALPPAEMLAVLRRVGCVICAAGRGPGPGRPQAVRAARRHRDGRVDPADRQLDHVQEDRRGHRRAGARRQGRQRRVHARARRGPASWRRPWCALGTEHGVRTTALLTAMDTPLGRAVGNAVEVEESVATLRGEGPPDLVEVTLALAREMLRAGRDRRRPRGGAGRRPGAGRVPGDDRRAGRRPGRAAAGRAAHAEVVPAAGAGLAAAARRAARSASPPGGWARAGPARRTRSAPPPACSAWPSRATGSRPGSRCWSCAPTSEPGSAAALDALRRRHRDRRRAAAGRLGPSRRSSVDRATVRRL